MQYKSICFIGGGNMAQAIISGLLKNHYPAQLIQVCTPHPEKLAKFSAQQINLVESSIPNNQQAVEKAEVIILAVKPQIIPLVCEQLSQLDFNQKLVISVAAGISTARLSQLLPSARYIVRTMPNTPALVSAGMTGLFSADTLPLEHRNFAQELMRSLGTICWVNEESQMHAITAGSGSSPAYFFLFMEAMQQVLMEMKLDADTARLLVQQSALGAAKMVIENPDISLATLRENVTSKGGTTAAALAVFEQQQFQSTVQQAMQACVARSQEMEKLF